MPEGQYSGGSGYIDNRFGWAGYLWDPVLELYHVRHRVYDPADGRWLQPDPIGHAGGWNLYEYGAGDYANTIDPWGLEASAAHLQQLRDRNTQTILAMVRSGQMSRQRAEVMLRNGHNLRDVQAELDRAYAAGFASGVVDGAVLAVNTASFGVVLSDTAAQIRSNYGHLASYRVGDIALTVAREAAVTLGTLGVGNLATSGVRWAYYANAGLSSYQVASGSYSVGNGIYLMANGQIGQGLITIGGGALQAGGGFVAARLSLPHEHHIATNKHEYWRPRFEVLFAEHGLTLSDRLNRVRVIGHAGPHPERYHELVYTRLRFASATEGHDGFLRELRRIRGEVNDCDSLLFELVRHPGRYN
ncbi:MAG: AHH domain-containing protein [Phycisphaeraceae bacterium]|nr:AHH domain-containing protein [Phycisphaeraceae bacterium]